MDLRRILRSKVVFFLLILTLIWLLSLFFAPSTLEPGTVANLDGNSNRIDFADKWSELPVFQRIVYYIGDATCHQISERSFYINGNQMPVCARDVAIYFGLALGLFAATLVSYSSSPSATFMNIFPSKFRSFIEKRINRVLFIIVFIGLLFLPLAIDGTLQLLTDYESNNLMRVVTGLPLGLIAGYVIGVLIATLGEIRRQDVALKKKAPDKPASNHQ